jgi:hypothetical protein
VKAGESNSTAVVLILENNTLRPQFRFFRERRNNVSLNSVVQGRPRFLLVVGLSAFWLLQALGHGYAQQTDVDHQSHKTDEASLADQLRQLQQKVAELEAALKQNHQAKATSQDTSGRMAGQGMTKDDDVGEMAATKSGQGMAGRGMGMMDDMMKMGAMPSKKGMSGGMGMMEGGMEMQGMSSGAGVAPGTDDSMMQMMKMMERMQMMQMMQAMQKSMQDGTQPQGGTTTQSARQMEAPSNDPMERMMKMMERMQMMQMMQMMQKNMQDGMGAGGGSAGMQDM